MISLSRRTLGLISILFGLYHALIGLVSLSEYREVMPAVVALVIYLFCLIWSLLDNDGIKMRFSAALLIMLLTIFISYLVFGSLDEVRQSSFTTWHVAAVSTVLSVITIRQYPILGWLGFFFLVAQTLMWGGFDVVFNSGIIGGAILISVSQAAYWVIMSTSKSAEDFRKKSLEIDMSIEVANASQEVRAQRLNQILKDVFPLLSIISENEGRLNDQQRKSALLLEAELRDRIRAPHLLNEDVVLAVRLARMRGVEVQLLDDGGLDDLDLEQRTPYLAEICSRLSVVQAGKVVIRAAKGDDWRLTMAAIRKDKDRPELFVRL